MERESQILTTEVEFEGESYSATYYVEHNIIHAHIGGRLMSTPVAHVPAERTVQALLQGHLLQSQLEPALTL
jgi:hypothetical protein